jgi:hypothetical protein
MVTTPRPGVHNQPAEQSHTVNLRGLCLAWDQAKAFFLSKTNGPDTIPFGNLPVSIQLGGVF